MSASRSAEWKRGTAGGRGLRGREKLKADGRFGRKDFRATSQTCSTAIEKLYYRFGVDEKLDLQIFSTCQDRASAA
jgi:hypothetical protein